MPDALTISLEPIVDRDTIEDALEGARDELRRGAARRYSWELVRGEIAEAIKENLGVGLIRWMGHCWAAARELHALKADAKPGERMILKLGKHTLEGKLHPLINIEAGGVTWPALRFDVPLALDLNAVTLVVRDGCLVSVDGGECAGSLRIEFDGADLSGKIPIARYQLPLNYKFKPPGIAIP